MTGRRLLRIGNFEFTNEHFRWISDYEITPGKESRPPWAVVVERIEWGRFYGQPKEFVQHQPRPIGDEERELQSLLQFLESHQQRLTEPADQAAWPAALEPVQAAYRKARRDGLAAFLAQPPEAEPAAAEDGQPRQEAVLEDGSAVPLREASADRVVQEIRHTWSEPAAAWPQYSRWHDAVRQRFHEQRHLEKYEIGWVNRRIEAARLAVRRQELDQQVLVLDLANQVVQVQNELQALESAREQAAQAAQRIRQRFGQGCPAAVLAAKFAAAVREEIEQQAAAPRSQLEALESELARAPEAARTAVQQFLDVTRECSRETAEMVRRVDELKRENARFELRLTTAQGQDKTLALADIVRAYPANQLGGFGKLGRVSFAMVGVPLGRAAGSQ